MRAAVTQMVQRLPTGWTSEGSESSPGKEKKCSILHSVHTGSREHPASIPTATWGSFTIGKAAGA
jgi:hypothetical protein